MHFYKARPLTKLFNIIQFISFHESHYKKRTPESVLLINYFITSVFMNGTSASGTVTEPSAFW